MNHCARPVSKFFMDHSPFMFIPVTVVSEVLSTDICNCGDSWLHFGSHLCTVVYLVVIGHGESLDLTTERNCIRPKYVAVLQSNGPTTEQQKIS